MRVVVLSILVSLVLPFTSYCQTLDEVIKVGNKSFDTKDYYKAFRLYEKVLEYVGKEEYKGNWDTLYVKYRYAESAQLFNNLEAADSMYTVLRRESTGLKNVFARSTFNLAQVKKSLAEEVISFNAAKINRATLEEARNLYQEFLDNAYQQHLTEFPASGKKEPAALSVNEKETFRKRAKKGLADCDAARLAANDHPDGIVLEKDTITRLPSTVNSEYSDLAPVLIGDELYFSSVKFPSWQGTLSRQSRTYSEVLKATISFDGQQGSGATILSLDTLAQSDFFNDVTDLSHTVHSAITRTGTWMYFSHCPQGRGEAPSCKLYRRKRTGGTWGQPEPLDNINKDGANTTQPSISYDIETGRQWLYFASDREGTKGGLDIWRAKVDEEDGSLSEPEHLSEVSSEWNDATPFHHTLSDRLFFSSDRESTFGLYDIFVWESCGSEKVVRNLGLPYNSGFNDQYYFLAEGGDRAFFSSDRPESTRFIDSLNACCQDIFTYPVDNTMELEIEVLGCKEENITSADGVTIYDITVCGCVEKTKAYFEKEGRKPVEGVIVPQEDGSVKYIATVNRYHTYRIFASDDDFETSSVNVTLDCEYDGIERVTVPPIQLAPAFVDLTFVVHDKVTLQPLELENYALEFTSEEAPAPEEVGKQTYRLFPENNYTLSIKAKNPAYEPFSMTFDRVRLTQSCTDVIHIELEKRCEVPPALEGIAFFFDNDWPLRPVRGQWKRTNDRYDWSIVCPYYVQWNEAVAADTNCPPYQYPNWMKSQVKPNTIYYEEFNLRSFTAGSWDRKFRDKVRFDTVEGGRIDTLMNLVTDNTQANLDRESLRYKVQKSDNGKFRITPDETLVEGRIDRFFERDLKGDLERFDSLISYIKNFLETGEDVNVFMQAFCSVRVSGVVSTYNAALAERRILCIENTMREALDEKWKGVSNAERRKFGNLNIIPEAVSDKGSATIFPDPNLKPDKDAGGTYFLSAALDRRVQINKIEFGKGCQDDEASSSAQPNPKKPGQP